MKSAAMRYCGFGVIFDETFNHDIYIYTRESDQSYFLLSSSFHLFRFLTRKCEVGFQTPTNFKMLHTNQAELNQLYGTFCRVWAAGGQATLTTTSLGGKVTAKLELELGQPTEARPGAPPHHHLRSATPFSSHGAPASGAARRPCHRGPAAKAKSRARAAAYQAAKAAAATAAQEFESESTPSTPSSGGTPSTQATSAPLAAPKPLNVLPSPPASDGQRLVVSVGRGERLPSFSQLDGQDDAISSDLASGASSYVEKEEEEEDFPEVLCDFGVNALPDLYSTPPAKVRHPVYGIGTFQSINPSGQYCYDFGLGYVIKVFNQPQGPQGPAFYY